MIREIQDNFINPLDNEEDLIKCNISLSNFFDEQKNQDTKHEFILILRMLSRISNEHHRYPNFFSKFKSFFNFFKDKIKTNFSNIEIFNLFKKNKKIILILIEIGILVIDQTIANIIQKGKFEARNYHLYFQPEIEKTCLNEENKENDKDEEKIKVFERNRQIGENDTYLCQLIRNDFLDDFIVYYNKFNFKLSSYIKPSIFETNPFLLKQNNISLIEYATFFGSIQIVKFLIINNVKLTKSLLLYSIHSNNAEMIHLLEEHHIDRGTELNFMIEEQNLKYLKESIKCFHNDIANYILNNILQEKTAKSFLNDPNPYKYYNFYYIGNTFSNISAITYLIKYDYYAIVDFLLKNRDKNVNSILIIAIYFLFMKFLFYSRFNEIIKINLY